MRARAVIVTIAPSMGMAGSCPASEPRATADQRGEKILHCYRLPRGSRRPSSSRRPTSSKRAGFGRPPEQHDRSALVERLGDASISYHWIYWRGGIAGASYVSDVAVLTHSTRGHVEHRTEPLADTGIVPVVPRVCKAAMGWVTPDIL